MRARTWLTLKLADPYLTITAGGKLLHKTEVVPQNLNPAFSPFVINVPDAGGFAALVTIECIDWDEDGNHDRIGSATCELGDFLTKKQIELMEKTSKRGGYLIIESCVGAVVPPPPPAYTFQFSAIGLDKKDGVLGKSGSLNLSSDQQYALLSTFCSQTRFLSLRTSAVWLCTSPKSSRRHLTPAGRALQLISESLLGQTIPL
jgi:hypothetical protein